jgi:hypothetical protein
MSMAYHNESPLGFFSKENTAHLGSPEDEVRYRNNMLQMAWLEPRLALLSEDEFVARSAWFREVFLERSEYGRETRRFIW